MAADNALVNDMSKLGDLCQNVRDGLGTVCNEVNKSMKDFRDRMHEICADPWMASMSVGDDGMGFSGMVNDMLYKFDKNINTNLNVMVNGIYGSMQIVARGHGFTEDKLPQNKRKYVVAISQLDPFFSSLPSGGVGIRDQEHAVEMAEDAIKQLSSELTKCKDTMKSVIQSNLNSAFQEETIQIAANKLGDNVIGQIEKGVYNLIATVKKFVSAHVQHLVAAKNAAASHLDEIGSGTN